MSKKKNRKKWYIGGAVTLLAGGACGYFMAWYADQNFVAKNFFGNGLIRLGILLLLFLAALYAQVILHEGGHLAAGLLSGYRFSSFRVGQVMLMRQNGRLHLRKMHIAGTGGQCLMSPPDMKEGKIPVMFYNFGGSLMNLVTGILFLVLGLRSDKGSWLSLFCLMLAAIGFLFAAMNGIPLHLGALDNDGYNALSLSRDLKAMEGFWLQLKVNEMQTEGMRLKDIPSEWFWVPADEEMKNSMVAAVGVFAANRLMDEHRFEEADACMEHLLDIDSGMAGVHRCLLWMDRLYCELIGACRSAAVEDIWDSEMKKFARAMKDFPSVIRTEYVVALLYENEEEKAKKIADRFEKAAMQYPYPSDIQSERELMEIAANIKIKEEKE